jgi:hypothetical protein
VGWTERATNRNGIRLDFDHSDLLILMHASDGLVRETHRSSAEAKQSVD